VNAGFFGQSSFSRLALVNERCLVTVAPDAPLAVLAPLGCAVQTGVGTVLNVLRPGPGSTLVIFGAGAVGLSAVMGTALLDVERLVVVDRVPSRLRLAEELGATHTIDAGSQDVEAELRELTAGRGADYCVEATGNTTVLEQAISLLAPAGTCAVVGAPRTGATISVDVKFLMRSRQLVGVTEGNSDPSLFVPQLIELHTQGKLPIEKLIEYYPFEDIERAAKDATSGQTIKPVLLFDAA
jgi:aryl-alcohol dehydrogenase